MKDLFDPETVEEVQARISRLQADTRPLWGRMTCAQAVAHCAAAMEFAVGDTVPPRMIVGRIIGKIIKPMVLREDEPMRRNSPTVKGLVVADRRHLPTEQKRLTGLINRFAVNGPGGCTTEPHSFFGPLTPEEWAILMYKHLDHHLRQFGV
ncbi:DUF1569 domain-containing protein [Acidobacteria bacterium AB60]|nr:DUF1569 domain-containing protein [Acidobacteria bacterium AB60]